MFSLTELILIAVIGLIFIGPKQIPEVARVLGNLVRDLKRASNEFKRQVIRPSDELTSIKNELVARVQKNLEPKPKQPEFKQSDLTHRPDDIVEVKPGGSSDNGNS